MSGSSPPPDNSLAVERMRQDAAEKERVRKAAEDQAHKEELAGLRTSARGGATGAVRNYFSSMGVDPDKYTGSIEQQLNDLASGIGLTDENPGQYYKGAGEGIYDTLQTGERTKASAGLDKYFAPNFETARAPLTLDDSYWAGIENEGYSKADDIIRNMLDRGVLTSSGYQAAKGNLDEQRAGVRTTLDSIGNELVVGEQGALRDIANKARATAGDLKLGAQFDPLTYSTEADTSFNSFLSSLGDKIRAQTPGDLFKTAGLAALGGAAQGAGNTPYDPKAAAGIKEDDDEDDTTGTSKNPDSIF
jgi:hypothetical protein